MPQKWNPAALYPGRMMLNAKGLGGPEPLEVCRMLSEARSHIDSDLAWRETTLADF